MSNAPLAVEARQLTRDYPGVRALDGADLACRPGRVHALLGENGAGKSTLVRCLTGNDRPDSGEIRIDGEAADLASPRHALDLGVSAVYQELTILPEMSIADNVMLGQERSSRGLLRRADQQAVVADALARVQLDSLDPAMLAGEVSLANKQLVEIARALVRNSRVLILDEPSAVLSGDKLEALHSVVRNLASAGTAVLYITHLLDEVAELADDVTVLRDGRTISTGSAQDYPVDRIVGEMVGRDIAPDTDDQRELGHVVLRCNGLAPKATTRAATPLDLEVRAGEIVGVAGLVGSGRSRMLKTVAGVHARAAGSVEVDGEQVAASVRAAVDAGVVFVPEERKTDGLVLSMTAAANMTLTDLGAAATGGWIASEKEERIFGEERARLGIRTSGPDQVVGQLSGGNQQKIVIAKWLRRNPRVLVMDEPTRGVDIGAKAEIYRIVRELAAAGLCVIFASSELPEILALADRTLVCRDGGVVGQLSGAEMTEHSIMALALAVEAA
ncbi:sugar ABC transporter ATP-binding protein [Nocardioidaceae bacterium SCSIO 66511]|nr:sugar ABC transporter ATP-binding protein [Nocardioidaceae bacterium SCSIO 66511]